jgi:ankyrin repeat protein
MSRKLTPRSTLEQLKREAKRWLRALQAGDPAARARLERALTDPPPVPTLRDVQLALAREHGLDGWSALKHTVERLAGESLPRTRDDAIQQLLMAAGAGDARRVIALLDVYPDIVNERAHLPGNVGKRTALHYAIGPGKLAVVDALLQRGADPNIRDDGDDAMPLHFAAEQGDLEIVKRLVEHGADPVGEGTDHELDVLGWATCFSYALHRDVAEYLLAHGARYTIFSAVALGATDAIRDLVARDRTLLDRPMDRTNHRRGPLHLAVIKKQPSSLATLLELGADIDARDAAGLTPLDQAALHGEAAMAHSLMAHGATLELPAAVALGRTDDIERLLRDDPDALRAGGRWRALILRAAEQAPAAVMETLLRHGAQVDAQDDAETAVDSTPNYTPLHAAAFSGNTEAVRVLLAHGANVRARDGKYHATPAGWADYAGHPEIRDMILEGPIDMFDAIAFDRVDRLQGIFERGSSLNQEIRRLLPVELTPDDRMKPWWTPLAYAIVHGKTDAARELLRLGARTTVREPNGKQLRDVAIEYGRDDIVELIDRHEAHPAEWVTDSTTHAGRVLRFLTNACPDHHVRGGWSNRVARDTAMRLLDLYPEIARDSIYTAVVCGEVELVRQMLEEHPELATRRGGPKGSSQAAGQRFVVEPTVPAPPLWDPLLYLAFARVPAPEATEHAVAIARLLLDCGADPNTYFMAGDARYSPLSGVIGEGEEARQPHPKRDELVGLLLDRGANPYDVQVFYNAHFKGDILWYLRLIHDHTSRTGRARDWEDPEWRMIDMGGYGSGARFLLDVAVQHDDLELARWILEHGADPNVMLPRSSRLRKGTLYEEALKRGHLELAELLARFGARAGRQRPGSEEQFVDAAMRLDRPAMATLVAAHPELRTSTKAIFEAAEKDRDDVVAALLDAGVSPDVEDGTQQRPLHIAAYAGSVRVAQMLIERGAAIDPVESSWGNTPLDAAIYADQQRMIELLARYSRDVWCLAFAGQTHRLREVLEHDPARARSSWNGWTLLMRLPGDERRALEVARLLLRFGAEPGGRNADGQTAAEIASARGLETLSALLRGAEAGRMPALDDDDDLPDVVGAVQP